MNSEKFIEFTSERRNRVLYPLPSQFVISQAQQKTTAEEALDPVCLSFPIHEWVFKTSLSTGDVSKPSPYNISNTIDNSVLVLNSDFGGFLNVKNALVGLCIVITNPTLATSNTRRITSSQYIGEDLSVSPNIFKCIITVSPPFPDSLLIEQNNCTFSICETTDVLDLNYQQIFIPSGLYQENAYINNYLVNFAQNPPAYAKIVSYDEITHLAQIEPQSIETFEYASSIRPEADFIFVQILPPIDVVNNAVIISGGITIDDYYKNYFIRIFGFPYYYTSKIIEYDGATQKATCAKKFPDPPTFDSDSNCELYKFSYDNVYPFTYNGTDRDPKFYRVELINLILPNLVLNVGYGGRIAFYPYVYVKMNNVSAFGRSSNLIMSNNPNSNQMLFRCPINDVNHPLDSPFIKIDGNGMSQVFQFAPSDDLEFEVRLPNGELFQTEMEDFYSPSIPNYQVQISAVFRLTKL